METLFCSYITRNLLYLFLSNLHCTDPRIRPISSLETLLPIYTSLTLYYNGCRSHLVYRNLILSQAHLRGKARTIHSFIQLRSVAEQIAGKTADITLDHWSRNRDGEEVTATLPAAWREASWNYLTVQKGHYKSLRPTDSAKALRNMSEHEPNAVHSVSSWMWALMKSD